MLSIKRDIYRWHVLRLVFATTLIESISLLDQVDTITTTIIVVCSR